MERLTAHIRELPVNPVMIRVGWPDIDRDWLSTYIDRLGREFVPAMRELELAALT